MDPALHFALAVQQWLGPDLTRWRSIVITELSDILDESVNEDSEWYQGLSTHIRAAYALPSTGSFVRVPTFVHLPQQTGYEGSESLQNDLYNGFPMLGRLAAGVGWHIREDSLYKDPLPIEKFYPANKQYIEESCNSRHHSEHAQCMLDELLAEHK